MESNRIQELRDNLLVTFGCRAGEMDAMGYIDLPGGAEGEDELTQLAVETVDEYIRMYINNAEDIYWDELIELVLQEKYKSKKEKGFPWIM